VKIVFIHRRYEATLRLSKVVFSVYFAFEEINSFSKGIRQNSLLTIGRKTIIYFLVSHLYEKTQITDAFKQKNLFFSYI